MTGPRPAPLGATSVDQFLSRYWQRRPLLLRQAFADFEPPVSAAVARALAMRDDVEVRVVERHGERWRVTHGPLERLPSSRKSHWTVLVQGVDLHDDGVRALLERFRFLPDARLDDVMISFATDGGGVGPHVDSYDVFLLQAEGRRRWRIGHQADRSFVPDLPLRILADFRPTDEYLLEAGDMLYLPPGWAHDGVAEGPCLTYSIGFRAPSRSEVLRAWFEHCADAVAPDETRFRDPGRKPTRQPARIPSDLAQTLRDWIEHHRSRPRDMDAFIGRLLSEPKPTVFFEPPARPLGRARFEATIARRGLALDRRTRMLHDARALYVNGEAVALPARSRAGALLRTLADARALDGTQADELLALEDGRTLVEDWYRAGWVWPGRRA